MKNKIQKKNISEDIENLRQRREERKIKEENKEYNYPKFRTNSK